VLNEALSSVSLVRGSDITSNNFSDDDTSDVKELVVWGEDGSNELSVSNSDVSSRSLDVVDN